MPDETLGLRPAFTYELSSGTLDILEVKCLYTLCIPEIRSTVL